jgi:hypothetical protein
MREDGVHRTAFAANVASYFVLGIDLHDDARWLFHQPILASWALVVVPLAAESAEKLAATWVLAFHR